MAYQCPHRNDHLWAAQWMEGGQKPPTFALLGHHYRGFGVVKVCDACKRLLAAGQPIVVRHKGQAYRLTPTGTPPLARPVSAEVA